MANSEIELQGSVARKPYSRAIWYDTALTALADERRIRGDLKQVLAFKFSFGGGLRKHHFEVDIAPEDFEMVARLMMRVDKQKAVTAFGTALAEEF